MALGPCSEKQPWRNMEVAWTSEGTEPGHCRRGSSGQDSFLEKAFRWGSHRAGHTGRRGQGWDLRGQEMGTQWPGHCRGLHSRGRGAGRALHRQGGRPFRSRWQMLLDGPHVNGSSRIPLPGRPLPVLAFLLPLPRARTCSPDVHTMQTASMVGLLGGTGESQVSQQNVEG